MVKKLNQQLVGETLKEKGLTIFSPLEFKRIFSVSQDAVSLFIHRQTKKHFLVKLRNGLYALSEYLPSESEVANRLYQPSYISFEYALSYYHLIPESVYTVTSATSRATRQFSCLGKIFFYHRLKKKLFFGYRIEKITDRSVLIATPEKTLLDYLYLAFREYKKPIDRLSLKTISFTVLKEYLKLYNKQFRQFALEIYDRYKSY